MKTIQLTYPHTLEKEALPETVAAIGFFDGIHKGHQQVIGEAIAEAKQRNMKSAVITFHPHPSVVLKQGTEEVQYITPLPKKKEILQQLNVDFLYIIKFDKQLSSLSPSNFIKNFIIGLHIKHLVAGFDFTFGHKGKGNMDNIDELAEGHLTYTTVQKVVKNNEKISSTKIRDVLGAGNIEEVNRLLGRAFSCDGLVVQGEKRGRKLGYPTANLEISKDALLPRPGVYGVKVTYNQMTYHAIANIGTNPTFTPERRDVVVEVHILDFDQWLYGQTLTVEWYHYVREEKKFSTVEQLIEEMKQDEEKTREYFKNQQKM